MTRQYVNDLKPGGSVDGVFVLSEKALGQKRNGTPYLNVMFADKTGRIKGVAWDDAEEIAARVSAGDFVQVQGLVSEYKGSLQIVIKSMSAKDRNEVDASDFIPASQRNPDRMFERLTALAGTIRSDPLRMLMEKFWADESFVNRFKAAPAAKRMHHAYLGGLLEHTLSLALLADRVAEHYSGIDRDLLLVGAMLHDIGKIREFAYDTRIDYSDEGRLVSHIVIGVQLLDKKITEIADFPEKTAMLLRHLIVSHHGSREFGSPELPQTLEAVLLNYLDEIDSKIYGIREFIATQDSGEDWTAYHRPLERFFYKGGRHDSE